MSRGRERLWEAYFGSILTEKRRYQGRRPIQRRSAVPHTIRNGLTRQALTALSWILPFAGSLFLLQTANAHDETKAPALADLPIEELLELKVSSASRFSQERREAPSAVAVITAEEIRTHGWRTLGEALGSLPGLYTSYDRSYRYLGARGFQRPGDYNTRFLLLVDGVRLNDGLYDQATVGTDFILDLDLVERIEYVPGPGSAVYGSNALFGVVNVITRPTHTLPQAEFALAAGEDGYARGRATLAWTGGSDRSAMLSVTRNRVDGRDLYFPEFDTPEQHNGVATDLDGDRATQLFARAVLSGWTLQLAHSDRNKATPTANYGQVFNDPHSELDDEHTLIGLRRDFDIGEKTRVSASAHFNEYRYLGDYVYGQDPLSLNTDDAVAQSSGGELQLISSSLPRHHLVAGLSFDYLHRRQKNFDVDPYLLYLDDARDDWRLGFYVEDEWRLSDPLILNVGARYDYDSTSGLHNVSPRAALIYRVSPSASAKAIVGSAYRSPNAYEFYYRFEDQEQQAADQLANPELRDEHIETAELIWEQRLERSGTISASIYHYSVSDLITFSDSAEGDLLFVNVDKANATGIELAYERHYARSRLRASYSAQRVRDSDSGNKLENSPDNMAKLNLSFPVFGSGLRANAEVQWLAARLSHNQQEVAGYWLANGGLSLPHALGQAEVSLHVYNIFDQHYEDPVGLEFMQNAIEQDGRTAVFKLRLGF